jgi:hypothetical protein
MAKVAEDYFKGSARKQKVWWDGNEQACRQEYMNVGQD